MKSEVETSGEEKRERETQNLFIYLFFILWRERDTDLIVYLSYKL